MPVYKGSNEVSSGNLKKGSTNIENGYKQTDQFYVNTNAIIINFVDAISGATMDTTQFSSTGTPGASFASFTRTITTDSGRIFQGTVSVAESGDTGNNVTASISGQGSTTATLNVSGTYPATGVTVTLTVNGATQVQLPSLNVVANQNNAVFSTSDGVNLGTFNYSTSQSVSGGGTCSGGTGNSSGTLSSASSSSYSWGGFSAGYPAGGAYGNGCGVTCTSSVSASKSGYNSGSDSYSNTGANPSYTGSCTWSPSSNPAGATIVTNPVTYNGTCPTCNSCSASGTSGTVVLSARLSCFGSCAPGSYKLNNGSYQYVDTTTCSDGGTVTTPIPGYSTTARYNELLSATPVAGTENCIGQGSTGIYKSISTTTLVGGGSSSLTGASCSCNIGGSTYSGSPYWPFSSSAQGPVNSTIGCGLVGSGSPLPTTGDSCTFSGVWNLNDTGMATDTLNLGSITMTCP